MDQPTHSELLGLVAEAARGRAEDRTRGCARPVRLAGSRAMVDTRTGELTELYSSRSELDGTTYVRCGNRRAAVCPTCSHEYKGDAWHLLLCGLAGGKGIPESVADRPTTFVTLTAPSFGAVHGLRQRGPCRGRRDRPLCPHGRPMWCHRRHEPGDRELGEPLCGECYDYVAHVLWQWHSPELWRRFVIRVQRLLAQRAGIKASEFKEHAKLSYSKVAEFQARGLVHFHAPIRLDGPLGPDGPATDLPLAVEDLEEACREAAKQIRLDVEALGQVVALRWGRQVDCRTITAGADRNGSPRSSAVGGRAHPEQVAAYLAKYLTKTTEDFGLPARVRSLIHARATGASAHALAIIHTCSRLAADETYQRIALNYATLGFRGHPITKSRLYSVTFGQLRRARRVFHRNPGLDPDADIRQLLDDEVPEGCELISEWVFLGQGYLDLDQAARAVMAAAVSRTRASELHTPAASL